ncbi:uncharacterized protein TRAVEDRAFT_49508 [Trametes versicolor FP-101664 SS1]|uniref:uncharacterized protein n=1 Tax=Trametes versicolor (strain FP-101664) TaxID=717944 RepID=UPI0004623477|nr:uncharacterized protein TRAVEDRAFT_49508 [Trametes versicolor FP-101664 SS1]EIW56688.1 hypothetical protein TRAVEDRAFT_49508 [Trametes versicolor FP-101664 SS1]
MSRRSLVTPVLLSQRCLHERDFRMMTRRHDFEFKLSLRTSSGTAIEVVPEGGWGKTRHVEVEREVEIMIMGDPGECEDALDEESETDSELGAQEVNILDEHGEADARDTVDWRDDEGDGAGEIAAKLSVVSIEDEDELFDDEKDGLLADEDEKGDMFSRRKVAIFVALPPRGPA